MAHLMWILLWFMKKQVDNRLTDFLFIKRNREERKRRKFSDSEKKEKESFSDSTYLTFLIPVFGPLLVILT